MESAIETLTAPAAMPLIAAIVTGSPADILRVRLLSIAQARQAAATNKAPVLTPPNAPGSSETSAPAATISSMPSAMRRSKFSRNTNHAISAVNAPSRLRSSDAVAADAAPGTTPRPCISSTGPATPPHIPGVTFERFKLPSLQELPLPLPNLAVKIDQKLRFALLFPRLAARRAEAVLAGEKVDVLYAYEVHGALAARKLRRGFRLPTVARFQGTVMHPTLGSALARLRKYEEVLALRLPADLYIMTDDGTRGDEVLARLNPGALRARSPP